MIFHYICKKKKMLAMIFLPTDTALLPIIIIGMFIYYAFKSMQPPPNDWPGIDFQKDTFADIWRKVRAQERDKKRYRKWLKEHQQPSK